MRAFLGRLGLAAGLLLAGPAAAQDEDPVEHGKYLVHAAGCVACHTVPKSEKYLAGGVALKTPFGTFYTPNITPDEKTGLGTWSEAQFLEALKHGRAPDGSAYYPAFPYTSYSGMTDDDAKALFAYLKSVPAIEQANREHELDFPFGWRWLAGVWQSLFFEPRPFKADPDQSEAWNRGAYLVQDLGHCGECHTPRGWLGATEQDKALSGNPEGPEGKSVPNITPGKGGIGDWSESDIAWYLKTGFLPDGDYVGGAMVEVVTEGTSKLTDDDRRAIAEYLVSVPPLPTP
ncbi:MAG: cytochrome c [Pseudomonadota bacterium]